MFRRRPRPIVVVPRPMPLRRRPWRPRAGCLTLLVPLACLALIGLAVAVL